MDPLPWKKIQRGTSLLLFRDTAQIMYVSISRSTETSQ